VLLLTLNIDLKVFELVDRLDYGLGLRFLKNVFTLWELGFRSAIQVKSELPRRVGLIKGSCF